MPQDVTLTDGSGSMAQMLDHLDFVIVDAGHAQRPWRTTVLDKTGLPIQRDRALVARCDSQSDLLQAPPIDYSVKCALEKPASSSGTALLWGNVHATDEAPVPFLCSLLTTHTHDAEELTITERAQNYPLWRARKKRLKLRECAPLLIFDVRTEGGRALSKCEKSKFLKDAGVRGLKTTDFHDQIMLPNVKCAAAA